MKLSVLFVGDAPSRKNTDYRVAFVGTRSGKTLAKWVSYLIVADDVNVKYINSDTVENKAAIQAFDGKIVALGYTAYCRIQRLGKGCFHLPHPSPRNRRLNNEAYEYNMLNICKKWLYNGEVR